MSVSPEPQTREQARQRLRVGMIGLAAVVLLIGLASAIFSSVNRDRPIDVAGAGRSDVVANMAGPKAVPSATPGNEPLAELGVAPSVANAAATAEQR